MRKADGGHQRVWVGGAALAALLGLLAFWGHDRLLASSFNDLQERGENTLRLAEASLRAELSRFERLPGLLAGERAVRSLVIAPRDPVLVEQANLYLRDSVERLGASDIYVMDRAGDTLAASNFDQPHSFVGGNFAFRPYFQLAIEGGEGRFFALGTTSNRRGYYFGAPVRLGGRIHGALIIKVDLDGIERAWASDDLRILVTDPDGVVFLSNRPDWLFSSLGPRSPEERARTARTRRYANAEIGEIAVERGRGPGGHDLLRAASGPGGSTEYLAQAAHMPQADWTVSVLSPTAGARVQARISVVAGLLGLGIAGFGGLLIWQRRRQLAERLQVQEAAQAELEQRVEKRTSQLARANSALRAEVQDRTLAEQRLRDTQVELVQAGKLAALGQMSAALSHEFNQPLAAARTYAENADLLVERGRLDAARDTLAQLLGMIERMGRISRHLRNFARKPHAQLRPVALSEAVAATQELLKWRIDRTGAVLEVDLEEPGLAVVAGPVRLQQVLVNLLSNALDACEEGGAPRLRLAARRTGDTVTVTLRDNGPGVPEALRARIFDPFFSTKGVGKGLGLGLSISYNIVHDFGGTLDMRNHPGGGAEFRLVLRAAATQAEGPEMKVAE